MTDKDKMQPIETVDYWVDAYSADPHNPNLAGGMIALLLREYQAMRHAKEASSKELEAAQRANIKLIEDNNSLRESARLDAEKLEAAKQRIAELEEQMLARGYGWSKCTEEKEVIKMNLNEATAAASFWKNETFKAEDRIKKSQEQEPVFAVSSGVILFFKGLKQFAVKPKLYEQPYIQPEVSELQRANNRLTERLNEANAARAETIPCDCKTSTSPDGIVKTYCSSD